MQPASTLPPRDRIARAVFTTCFVAAAVSHAASAARGEPDVLRHVLFIGINLSMAALVRLSPRAALVVAVPLGIQQLFSHGASLLEGLSSSRIDWASVGVLIFFPALIAWLITVVRRRVS